jgi:hypothetical protein
MEDKDKAYLVKLLTILVMAFFTGILTGSIYPETGNIGRLGILIFLAASVGSSFFVKSKYDLSEMSDVQILRHGVIVTFLTYIFFWVTIFQFVYF